MAGDILLLQIQNIRISVNDFLSPDEATILYAGGFRRQTFASPLIRNRLIILLFFIVLVGFACKKKSDDNIAVDPSSSLIKTIIQKNPAGDVINRIEYQYDNNNRITIQKLVYPSDSASFTYKYEYFPSVVIERIFLNDTALKNKNVYYLNIEGLATEVSWVSYLPDHDSVTGINSIYDYNSEGWMIKSTDFLSDSSIYKALTWQIADGNVSSFVYNIPGAGINSTETYSYFPGSINSVGNKNKGLTFLGKSNTNLVSSSMLNSASVVTANFSYMFDSYNRVSIMTVSGGTLLTISPSSISYTYY